MTPVGRFFIGTSGFSYNHWSGLFYPEGLPKRERLEYYSTRFDTVEINSSFYHLPRTSTCESWKNRVPGHFVFTMKASRFITHLKKLRDTEEPVRKFFEVVDVLGGRLGPVLFQLPPGLERDIPLLERFIAALPPEHRYVFEFRNNTWYDDGTYGLLDRTGCSFCVHDLPGKASPFILTGDFAYFRFHGARQAYSSCYTDDELRSWSVRMREIAESGRDVYAYFNNDIHGYAVENAETLRRYTEAKTSD